MIDYFLIIGEISRLSFIKQAHKTLLCLQPVDACAMGGHIDSQHIFHAAHVLMLKQVAYTDLSAKFQIAEADAHCLLLVRGVVERNGTRGAMKIQDVFHQHVCFANVLYDVCLQVKWVLVQGNEFLVLQQVEGALVDGGHVAADE